MLKRLARVLWWGGALAAALFTGAGIWLAFTEHGEPLSLGAAFVGMGATAAVICWAGAFICGGSFWRPPQIESTLMRR